ncbi:hypothetical protein [Atlantibacter subterraneus]|uniref:hypothetical protein n=1 Tax=Atlantibacter subterraneus TaxID=255519 RepID=UPI00289C3CE6|nr:hypothetical protein [Atlantibacter subterranea]
MKWIIVVLFFAFSNAHAEDCSQQDFDKADMELDSLTSWKAVDDFFSRHSKCDVGYLREGTSEKIVRLLVDKWGQLNELSVLVKTKPALGDYVVDHIGEILDVKDVEKVRDYSASNCQIDDKALCKKLHDAAVYILPYMSSQYQYINNN